MVKLACDMMGSDLGPKELSKAVVKFVKDHEDVELTCFGKKDELAELEGLNRIKIVRRSRPYGMRSFATYET